MRFLVLATDYDGTLAHHGRVSPDVLTALERVSESGRKLVLVTGRELPDLLSVFPEIHIFDHVIAENGAVLYTPATRDQKLLGEKPPKAFMRALEERGVKPLSSGRIIVSTWQPHERTVIEIIKTLGLELTVSFNKGAVMILPSGINKGSGLKTALAAMGLSTHNVVGVGDGENDHAFLKACECSVAVANAVPMLKDLADVILNGENGVGIATLVNELVQQDLEGYDAQLRHRYLQIGTRPDKAKVFIHPLKSNILVAGPSGSGKSTFTQGFLERLSEGRFQFCILDPEGDYESMPSAVTIGDAQRDPSVEQVFQHLEDPKSNAVVNLIGLPLADRPGVLSKLFPRLQDLRLRSGRPHWFVLDEAHHLIPAAWTPAALALPQTMHGLFLITVHPEHITTAALSAVDVLVLIGRTPQETLDEFCRALGQPTPDISQLRVGTDEAVIWFRKQDSDPFVFTPVPAKLDHQRHRRKYAHGALGPDNSFYFRGPEMKLNLRAQNLEIFVQIAEGLDDASWQFHLRNGDYVRWFQDVIKDPALAAETARVARLDISPGDSRRRVKEAVQRRYSPAA